MIVTCEECGKKYQIYPEKIQEEDPRFQCKNCRNWIFVPEQLVKSTAPPLATPDDFPVGEENETADDIFGDAFATLTSTTRAGIASDNSLPDLSEDEPIFPESADVELPDAHSEDLELSAEIPVAAPEKNGRRMGLLGKMLFLFLFLPVIFIIAAGGIYVWQLDRLAGLISAESTEVVTELSEDIIAEKARAVALQVKVYLKAHPELVREDFNRNPEFRKIALQKVGNTGYTALYERPKAKGDVWRTWVHSNPSILGIDMTTLRKSMGKNFPGFWKIYSGVISGKPVDGYYKWHESDGTVRDKYMACAPVIGTRFIVAATTYMDEFTEDVAGLKTKAASIAQTARKITIGIVLGMICVIFFSVFFYARGLTAKIRSLTGMTDKISVGDLDAELEVVSDDEIGDLGEAIRRMQDSIKLSISRLKKRH